jgi:hypothetical protein
MRFSSVRYCKLCPNMDMNGQFVGPNAGLTSHMGALETQLLGRQYDSKSYRFFCPVFPPSSSFTCDLPCLFSYHYWPSAIP